MKIDIKTFKKSLKIRTSSTYIILEVSNYRNSIIEAREIKPFISKEDVSTRTGLNNTHLKQFERIGLLDHLDDENQLSLF